MSHSVDRPVNRSCAGFRQGYAMAGPVGFVAAERSASSLAEAGRFHVKRLVGAHKQRMRRHEMNDRSVVCVK